MSNILKVTTGNLQILEFLKMAIINLTPCTIAKFVVQLAFYNNDLSRHFVPYELRLYNYYEDGLEFSVYIIY